MSTQSLRMRHEVDQRRAEYRDWFRGLPAEEKADIAITLLALIETTNRDTVIGAIYNAAAITIGDITSSNMEMEEARG